MIQKLLAVNLLLVLAGKLLLLNGLALALNRVTQALDFLNASYFLIFDFFLVSKECKFHAVFERCFVELSHIVRCLVVALHHGRVKSTVRGKHLRVVRSGDRKTTAQVVGAVAAYTVRLILT